MRSRAAVATLILGTSGLSGIPTNQPSEWATPTFSSPQSKLDYDFNGVSKVASESGTETKSHDWAVKIGLTGSKTILDNGRIIAGHYPAVRVSSLQHGCLTQITSLNPHCCNTRQPKFWVDSPISMRAFAYNAL